MISWAVEKFSTWILDRWIQVDSASHPIWSANWVPLRRAPEPMIISDHLARSRTGIWSPLFWTRQERGWRSCGGRSSPDSLVLWPFRLLVRPEGRAWLMLRFGPQGSGVGCSRRFATSIKRGCEESPRWLPVALIANEVILALAINLMFVCYFFLYISTFLSFPFVHQFPSSLLTNSRTKSISLEDLLQLSRPTWAGIYTAPDPPQTRDDLPSPDQQPHNPRSC